MATVYLAEDLKHHRRVAVKVLRPELAVIGADRFVQEIETTAGLQHPHILPLFDSGEADSFLYYVMPFIDGETLRDKLDRERQLGIDESVRIATDVADALDYAHRQKVIHRDIKPENILLHDGRPMVADFGIALAVSAAAGGRMTETGLSLGTPHYMSPEQATAEKDLTNRSDVYSLGCVLYEMLTGGSPHSGASAQQIIVKIVTDEARPVTDLRKSVPRNVAAATAKSLEKLPADRFETAAAFAAALHDPTFATAALVGPAGGKTTADSWNGLARSLALLAALLAVVAVWVLLRPGPGLELPTYDVGLPSDAPMLTDYLTNLSISPRGDFVVYVARRDSTQSLWYRSLLDADVHPIAGTEGAWMPAVSPDGERVAFLTVDGLARVIPTAGGSPFTVQQLEVVTGLQWVSGDELLLSDGDGNRIHWVEADGDNARSSEGQYCILPQPLPDARHVLCGGGGDQYGYVADVEEGRLIYLRESTQGSPDSSRYLRGGQFRVVDGAYLTYMSVEGDIRAAPFDPRTFEVGRPVTVVSGVRREPYTGAGQYDVSADGTLVYAEGGNGSLGEMVRAEDGRITALDIEPAYFLRYDVSANGRWLAAVVEGVDEEELRIYDLASPAVRPQVWLRGGVINAPRWLPNRDQLIVSVSDVEATEWAAILGSPRSVNRPDTLFAASGDAPNFGSFYGDTLLIGSTLGTDPVTVIVNIARSPATLDTLPVGGAFASLSPDGRWLAYQPGMLSQILVSPYPALDRRVLVTASGGLSAEPLWLSRTELVYWRCCYSWYRVTWSPASENQVGATAVIHHDARFSDTPGQSYTLMADGSLVYVRGPERRPVTYLRVVPHWVERMKQAVAEANR